MEYLLPSEISEFSVVAIDFNDGSKSSFFINKFMSATLDKEKGGVCIYGRFTDAIICNYEKINIEDEEGLLVYKVVELNSTNYHKQIKGFRRLSKSEKKSLMKKISDFKNSKCDNARRIYNLFKIALSDSKVGQSNDIKKDISNRAAK